MSYWESQSNDRKREFIENATRRFGVTHVEKHGDSWKIIIDVTRSISILDADIWDQSLGPYPAKRLIDAVTTLAR